MRKQLQYLKRNIKTLNKLLDAYESIPFAPKEYKYFLVINTLYGQQKKMYDERTHSVDDRIVSIHQPHVRPIVRGKAQAKVEFGAKIHVSLVDGIAYLDQLSWDAFNEGTQMIEYVEQYKRRFGFYPAELLADQIYCTRVNRAKLKGMGVQLIAKPLGRPSAVPIHVSPGERNPIEGKFGQAKTGVRVKRIRARLKGTSESWDCETINHGAEPCQVGREALPLPNNLVVSRVFSTRLKACATNDCPKTLHWKWLSLKITIDIFEFCSRVVSFSGRPYLINRKKQTTKSRVLSRRKNTKLNE